ncbi:sensor histidine kinase (plasmid) [Paraburkholderia sp. D15]|uniref:sensor histidine kinase n=1 Tax=Paraburkholderia sp. D15 TaxID=2880218 RepID=UPI00247A7256|nr:sensor histidine kinase [Paraburkholderia sp. D15]WGS54921.1 sensor histidine kinase [Paraburkholderia sp. D15]
MTLSDFIDSHLEALIDDWTAYARALSPAESQLTDEQLRNSARNLLTGIAADMRELQTARQAVEKSHGDRPSPNSAFNYVGRQHADDRLAHGFDVNDVVAEFRALRASVLRRWQAECLIDAASFHEMIRFNEAVDQMVAESVRRHSQRSERIRDLFAGVLAHDLRSPVGAILNSIQAVQLDKKLSSTSLRAITIALASAIRAKRLVDDLFIFARARLGSALPVELTQQDMGRICEGALEEVRASHPDASIRLQLKGELSGVWDGARIGQLFVNLLTNAVQHGSADVILHADGSVTDKVTVAVWNGGDPIPEQALPTIFNPLTRVSLEREQGSKPSGLGLGLFICRCIAEAHAGTITAESNTDGTVFKVQIPCFPADRAD